ncbi:substrate-binding domain-containing protein [Labrys okinawensis]|uniref:substrate-binding domain-containing protein n=1 Tax=Labrys okinawensis TaxID=346911 RepID=UPI0039BD7504
MTDIFTRRQIAMLLAGLGLAASAPAAFAAPKPAADPTPVIPVNPGNLRLAVLLPAKDDPFYKACADGAQEAAAQIGGLDIVVAGPDKRNLRDQAILLNGFVKQKVDAIAIAPVDAAELGPICRRAMARGIKVISFDQPLPQATRLVHLDAVSSRGKASAFMDMLAGDVKQGGDIAIIAGNRPGSDGQALLSDTMAEWLKPAYGKLKLASTVFGNEDDKAGYAATEKLLADHPDLKGILVFNGAALVGAAQCIADKGLTGKVFVTGFGRPSQLKTAMAAQTIEYFASVNPVDLGYGAVEIAAALAKNTLTANAGSTLDAGRLGQITMAEGGVVTLKPFVVDEKNFSKFADVY